MLRGWRLGAMLLAGGLVCGCEAVHPPAAAYACEGGVRMDIRFERDHAQVLVPGGGAVRLPQQPSASGFWYAGQGHVLRGKGREAQWTSGAAEPLSCLQVGP